MGFTCRHASRRVACPAEDDIRVLSSRHEDSTAGCMYSDSDCTAYAYQPIAVKGGHTDAYLYFRVERGAHTPPTTKQRDQYCAPRNAIASPRAQTLCTYRNKITNVTAAHALEHTTRITKHEANRAPYPSPASTDGTPPAPLPQKKIITSYS